MTSTDLKNILKDKGFDTTKISIKKENGGYSTAFRVTVKDVNINALEVERALKNKEDISYDERTGEILSGGNTYIFVDYSADAEKFLMYAGAEKINKTQTTYLEGTNWRVSQHEGRYYFVNSLTNEQRVVNEPRAFLKVGELLTQFKLVF